MVEDLALAISLEGGRLRLLPGPQLMMQSQPVPGNRQRSSRSSQSSHGVHTSVVTVSSGSEPSTRKGTCPAGTVPGPNRQALRDNLLATFRATSVPWGPEGQMELIHPREKSPRSSSLQLAYLMSHSHSFISKLLPEYLQRARHYRRSRGKLVLSSLWSSWLV